jgi:hypothetical protein
MQVCKDLTGSYSADSREQDLRAVAITRRGGAVGSAQICLLDLVQLEPLINAEGDHAGD